MKGCKYTDNEELVTSLHDKLLAGRLKILLQWNPSFRHTPEQVHFSFMRLC